MAATSQRKILLSKPEDWDTWISLVRIKATNLRIWHLIDPDYTIKPAVLEEPEKPIYITGRSKISFNKDEHEFWKAQQQLYKSELAEFKEQRDVFTSVITFIYETITAQNAVLIQQIEAHPYDILKALKERLAPTDAARSLLFRNQYDRLRKGPDSQNIETWVNEWQQMFTEASKVSIPEVQGDRPIMDFLLAIFTKNESYATSKMAASDFPTFTMDRVIEDYRKHLRIRVAAASAKKGGEHSAFATTKEAKSSDAKSSESSNNPTYKGNRTPAPTCLCGRRHWYPECFYLNPNRKRPSGWTESPEIRKKVDDARKDHAIDERIKRSLARQIEIDARASSSSSTSAPNSQPQQAPQGAAKSVATAYKAYAAKSSIRNILLVGSAADIHICNSTMQAYYTKERDAHSHDRVEAGDMEMVIEHYGSLAQTFDTPNGPEEIVLSNVAYVPNFLTNVAAVGRFMATGVHFDTSVPHMHIGGQTKYYVYRVGDLFTFTNQHQQAERHELVHQAHTTTKDVSKKARTANEWHSIMAHPSHAGFIRNSSNSSTHQLI